MKRGIRCGGMCTAHWRQLCASLEMAPMTAFGAFLITVFTTHKSGATEYNFIVRLITFNLLDLRLSLDCKLPKKFFNGVLLWRGYLYSR